MFNTIKYTHLLIITALISMSQTSCKKLVEIDPPATSLTVLSAFNDDYATASVMTGHYSTLSFNNGNGTLVGISRLAALSSDELTLWSAATSPTYIAYYTNNLYSIYNGGLSTPGTEFWPYTQIYECNTVIENVKVSTGLSSSVKNQVLGEAKFMRACYFFYLANLYGDIPMPLNTDIKINALLARTPKAQVYQQIITDLKDAEGLLSADYLDGGLKPYTSNVERVRPTKWAALALLARTYLYIQDYTNAEFTASNLINNTALFNIIPLNDVFKANSKEAIWQLQTVLTDRNTNDGNFFIQISTGPNGSRPVYLSETMLSAFEVGDARKTNGNWVNSITTPSGDTYYFPFKYKLRIGSTPGLEYIMMFRLGEQYLIRAEARAKLGNVSGSRDDLFAIRRRAGLPDATLTANDQNSLLSAVMHERQVELFTEWGHRWFDLKRTGTIDAVMGVETPKKGGTWQSTDALYPLPYEDVQRDKNLTQNPGY
jgi:hypothetical protein